MMAAIRHNWQVTCMFGFDRIRLQLFARRGGRNYMMRSEKRPSYNNYTQRPRKPKRRRTRYAYLILTLLVSILLWPVGLFLIWNRRLRCKAGGKILWSAATLAVFCCLVMALLTVPTNNEQFQRFQDDANDLIATVGADLEIAWQTFSERSSDAWGNMRTVGYSVGNFALNKTADGLEAGVALAENVRGWVGGLFPAADEQAPAGGLEATEAPEETPDASAPAQTARPSATPAATPTPTPIARLFSTAEPSDAPSAAELAVSGLALARAGMNAEESGAPEAGSTAYPTPTTRPQASAETESGDSLASAEPTARLQATGEPEATDDAPQASAEAPSSAEPTATVSSEPSAAGATEAQVTPQPARAEPTPTPTAELPEGETVEAKPAGEFTVYHTANGRWYHTTATCSGMRNAQEYTLAQSVEDGFEPCPNCDAPAAELLEAENVVWVDEDSVYHISDECSAFAGDAALMPLEEAVDAQCVPCAACGANALADGVPETALDEEALLELAREVTVYFYDGSVGYHAESSCYGMSGAPARTLYEAIEMDKPPCSRCNPPTLEDLPLEDAE